MSDEHVYGHLNPKPDYEIRGFQELVPILRDDFGFGSL